MSAPNAVSVRLRAGRLGLLALAGAAMAAAGEAEGWKPYRPPQTEREDVFAFTEKPSVKRTGEDRYEISFAVKGFCDVTVEIADEAGRVIRHVASGVLGGNAPPPFQKNSLKQALVWNGKDDLDGYPPDTSRLRARVRLGLNPVFDKRIGGTSPMNLPGYVWGIGLSPEGAYVAVKGPGDWGHVTLRHFGLDGRYRATLVPPPSTMPLENLAGSGYVEYEPGQRVWHGRDLYQSVAHDGFVFPSADGKGLARCQVALAGKRFLYASGGDVPFAEGAKSRLHWFRTDGSTDPLGLAGTERLAWGFHAIPLLAISPDDRWLYMVSSAIIKGDGARPWDPVLIRAPADGSAKAEILAGEKGKPGNDNAHFNGTAGLDVDAQGRIYVSDSGNNRVQVFSPEGKHLKTIPLDRPRLLQVHRRSGSIYVQHAAREGGRSIARLSKLISFDNPVVDYSVDGIASGLMALDSWSDRPRLWLAGSEITLFSRGKVTDGGPSLVVYEENGKFLEKAVDFDAEAKQADGESYQGSWSGSAFDMVFCDPVREQLYHNHRRYDLKTGKPLGLFTYSKGYGLDWRWKDIAFDKHGYLHLHFQPSKPCVLRLDPGRAKHEPNSKEANALFYPEVPYNYGEDGWRQKLLAPIATKCQPGAKGFQDGMGVNMRGDLAVGSNIYYVPKMEEGGYSLAAAGVLERKNRGEYTDAPMANYANFLRNIEEAGKRGEEVYYVRRKPGIPLAGATLWTYDRSGELRNGPAVVAGQLFAGVRIDEDGSLYFVNSRLRLTGGQPFLAGKAGWNGTQEMSGIFTGTLIKTKRTARFVSAKAAIPMDRTPERPPELAAGHGDGGDLWVEGAEWFYAGVSPIVRGGCSCPSSRFHLDWHKRSYVPEAYRHSIGILDTNGNLIMHLGRYGNFDEAPGGKNGAKPGGSDLGIMLVRFISGTDQYLVYEDWGEKIIVLKLTYHAEESVKLDARRSDGRP